MKSPKIGFHDSGNRSTIALPALDDVRLLPLRSQILLGSILTVVLAGSFFLTGSLIVYAAILAACLCFAVVRNPVSSLFTFVIINVILTVRTRERVGGGAPSVLDLGLGIILVGIIAYWLVRLRLFDRETVSTSGGQLLIALFIVWSIFVTGLALFGEHNSFADAIREILNLSPLLILPPLYYRFVKPDSEVEYGIFFAVVISGIFMVIWNYFKMRSNIIKAIYLYQMGRGNFDEMISALVVFIATSCLMTVRRWWIWILSAAVMLLGMLGVVISFSRSLYVLTFVCVVCILMIGDGAEKKRGILRVFLTILAGVGVFLPIYFSSPIIRLMVSNYALRFVSTQHLTTDLSLVNRYIEWGYEWQAIKQSPILGHGFGTQFRAFNIFSRQHDWMGFSHSSYLFILFKTGFVGAVFFFGAYLLFLIKGYHILRTGDLGSIKRIIMRASIVFLVGVLIYSYTAPILDSKTDLIWVGLIWGFILVTERQLRMSAANIDDPIEEKQSSAHVIA